MRRVYWCVWLFFVFDVEIFYYAPGESREFVDEIWTRKRPVAFFKSLPQVHAM